ncbi:MAG: DUF151 domain-containing protein [Bacteroides sp.]|nr:DUF151 domain-containing protein [Bacteroides sp.]
MVDRKIELKVLEVTQSDRDASVFAMILGEVSGDRQLPVIISALEAQSILIMLRELSVPRPFTHDLFFSVAGKFDFDLKEVLIYRADEGIFFAYTCFEKDGEVCRIDSRTSDAVALALRFRSPIYIYELVLDSESATVGRDDTIPAIKPASNIKILRKALEKAIKNENYELAAILSDQIKKIESGSSSSN